MQVKKYEAKSMQEALKKIKMDLGPEAVILKAKRKKGLLGITDSGVEVTAAIGKNSLIKKQFAESRMSKETAEKLKNSTAKIQKEVYDKYAEKIRKNIVNENLKTEEASINLKKRKPIIQTKYIDISDDDIVTEEGAIIPSTPAAKLNISSNKINITQSPKKAVQEVKQEQEVKQQEQEQAVFNYSPDLDRYSKRIYITERLLFDGIEKHYVDQIMFALDEITDGKVEELDDEMLDKLLLKIIGSQIKVQEENLNNIEHQKIMAFVGSGGIGKTTTVAKMAARYSIDQDLNVGVICCDTNNVGSIEQLKVYCKIMDVPLKVASGSSQLVAGLRDLANCDIILIDTPSISHREQDKLSDLGSLLAIEYPIHINLVISATTRETEMKELLEYYNIVNYSSIIFTKMDETSVFGSLFNTLVKSKKPVDFVTTGRKVPENILKPTAEQLAEVILNRTRL